MTDRGAFLAGYTALNGAQKQAVDAIDGSVIVLAGPGAGKTQILSLRVAAILEKTDAQPSNILCLTFTDAATKNMRERLTLFIGGAANKVHITTFHSLGSSIIQDNPRYFPFEPGFEPISDIDKKVLLRKILQNMSYKTQFKAQHPKLGWIYIEQIASRVQDLKKEMVTPDEFEALLTKNNDFCLKTLDFLAHLPEKKISKNNVAWVTTLLELCQEYCCEKLGSWDDFGTLSMARLKNAFAQFEKTGKTTAISKWKTEFIEKKNAVFAWRYLSQHEQYLDIVTVYREYQKALFDNAWFDYEDMLIKVVAALQEHEDLRYEYQERYQYVLVDEFQDTNQVQLEFIKLLTDHPVHEGNPNLMVVGDDDQAIFKFQGANISNILSFTSSYDQSTRIAMYENYRSPQVILDLATGIISNATQRLDTEKKLVSSKKQIEEKPIEYLEYTTQLSQYQHVATRIAELLATGVLPQDIAVIARKHSSLTGLVPHLNHARVPYFYQKRLNVLENNYVIELLNHLTFLHSISNNKKIAFELLPQILRCPFWQIPREQIIAIAVEASSTGISWYEVIKNSDFTQSKSVLTYLTELSTLAETTPAQQLFNYLTGATTLILADGTEFTSPFKSFYFGSDDIFDVEKQGHYLSFLSAVRALLEFVRTMRHTEHVSLTLLLQIISEVESVKSQIMDTSPFNQASSSVNLLTAHGCKGLEFEYVFLVDATQSDWFKPGHGQKIGFPQNLPLIAEKDDQDDALRLFFVALTRAKRKLVISTFSVSIANKNIEQIGYLAEVIPVQKIPQTVHDTIKMLHNEMLSITAAPYTPSETSLLRGILENYKLSVTHLNNFLDLTRGGPYYFLEQNLLRFPQAIKAEPAYGSSIHTALEVLSRSIQKTGAVPSIEFLQDVFEKDLRARGLAPTDFAHFCQQGRDNLGHYVTQRAQSFNATDLCEKNFAPEYVVVQNAVLTGKIDRMQIDHLSKKIVPIDYKTGKSFHLTGKQPGDLLKRTKYYRQLAFYKLLIENSRTFGSDFTVEHGILEFVDAHRSNVSIVVIDHPISEEETELLSAIISVVWQRIMTLDFPTQAELDQFKNTSGEFDASSNAAFITYLLA